MPIPRITREEVSEIMWELVEYYGFPGTPRNTDNLSDTLIDMWYRVLSDKSYNQVRKAVDAHLAADDSLKGVFPLPGRIRKLTPSESIYTKEEIQYFTEVAEKEREEQQELERKQHEERIKNDPEYAERYNRNMAMMKERIRRSEGAYNE